MSEFMSEFALKPHLAYNWMVVAYFFFGGLAAGAYLFSVAANYWLTQFKPLARNAALLAPFALVIGMLLLLLDLGIPARGILLGIYFNPASVLSWGSVVLGLFFVVSVINAYAFFKNGEWDSKAARIAVAGVPLSLALATYTGILLNCAPGVVLWHSTILPVLFLNGGLISGIAAVMLFSSGSDHKELLAKLGRIVAGLVVLEVVMTAAEVIVLAGGGEEEIAASQALLAGKLSGLFWGAQILLGAIIPASILASGKASGGLQTLASALLLLGVYAMRHIIVIGGQLIG